MHGNEPRQLTCPAIDGLIEETGEITGEILEKEVLDAALIFAVQAIEHYEITRYGSLVAWARRLGRPDCAAVLQQTLDEEKAADKKLTMIAENKINLPRRRVRAGAGAKCEAAATGRRFVLGRDRVAATVRASSPRAR